MKPRKYMLVALLAHAPLALANPDTGTEDCAAIDEAAERLACYDRTFGKPVNNQQEADIDRPDEAMTENARVDEPPAPAPSEFGAEQLKPDIPDFIEARLIGDFNGWSGNTIFHLDNGQVWRQTKNYIKPYQPPDPIPSPRVTIEKAAFGSYNLRVEGIKRIVQVRRIK